MKSIKDSLKKIKNPKKLFLIFYGFLVSLFVIGANLYFLITSFTIIPYKYGSGIVFPISCFTQLLFAFSGLIGSYYLLYNKKKGYYLILLWGLCQIIILQYDNSWLNIQGFFAGSIESHNLQLIAYNGIYKIARYDFFINYVGLFLSLFIILTWIDESPFIKKIFNYISEGLRKPVIIVGKILESGLFLCLLAAILAPYINNIVNKNDIEFEIHNLGIECEIEFPINEIITNLYIVNSEIYIKNNNNENTSIENINFLFKNMPLLKLPELDFWLIYPVGFMNGQLLGFHNGKFIGSLTQYDMYYRYNIPDNLLKRNFKPIFLKAKEIKVVNISFIVPKYFFLRELNTFNIDIDYKTIGCQNNTYKTNNPFFIIINENIPKYNLIPREK